MNENDENEKKTCAIGDPEKALEKRGANADNDCTMFVPKKVRGDRCCSNCEHCE